MEKHLLTAKFKDVPSRSMALRANDGLGSGIYYMNIARVWSSFLRAGIDIQGIAYLASSFCPGCMVIPSSSLPVFKYRRFLVAGQSLLLYW